MAPVAAPEWGESHTSSPAPTLRPLPPARLCLPSLQLFDAHHEVEVALGVLFDDVPHVVGLPCLLQARKT